MTEQALALFRRLNAEYNGLKFGPRQDRVVRLGRIKYRAWKRWKRRVNP